MTALGTTQRSHAPGHALQNIAAAMAAIGLRAIVDPELEIVRAACPDCRADEADPLGMYLPLVIAPRGRRTYGRCDACGARHDV